MPRHRPRAGRKDGASLRHEGFFEERVARDPDIPLFELRDALAAEGIRDSSIANRLFRPGFSSEKNRWWPPGAAVQG